MEKVKVFMEIKLTPVLLALFFLLGGCVTLPKPENQIILTPEEKKINLTFNPHVVKDCQFIEEGLPIVESIPGWAIVKYNYGEYYKILKRKTAKAGGDTAFVSNEGSSSLSLWFNLDVFRCSKTTEKKK